MSALLDHKKLCREMKAQSLKQEPLAEQLNISVRHLRNLRTKDTNVSSALLYKMSEVLRVPMNELMVDQEDQE